MKSIFTNTAEITLHEEGYLEIRLLDTDVPFDLEEAKRQYEVALELTKGKDYLVLINTEGDTVQPTKEAQEYLIKADKRIAEAIIVESLAMRILSRFYVRRINTHSVKVFKTRDQAVEWLLTQAK